MITTDFTNHKGMIAKGRNMRRFFERQRLVSQTKHKKFNTKYRTMTIAYYQSG